MSPRRLFAAFGVEIAHSFKRPLFYIAGAIVALNSFGLSTGNLQISSGDSSVGGTKAWITSEFAQTQTWTYLTLLYFAVIIAIAAGLTLLRDREQKVDVILHPTPLTAAEYVWGRFLAVMTLVGALFVWQALTGAFFNHVVPNGSATEIRGPFLWSSYFRPALMIGVPFAIFFAGLSMWIGERTRNAVLVFLAPIAALLISGFFLWTWSPSWLSYDMNRVLQVIEPSGYRWLNETLLKVDRGVKYYNTQPVPYDGLFGVNRLLILLVGFGGVLLTQRSVARSMRGVETARARRHAAASRAAADVAGWDESATPVPVAALGMSVRTPRWLPTVIAVARTELKELLRQPALYFFMLVILIQVLGRSLLSVGAFDTPVLLTPGTSAVSLANESVTFVCLLMLFYTVVSLERERTTGLDPVLYATPVSTGAVLFGKSVANGFVGAIVLIGSLVASWLAISIQHTVPFSMGPYLLVWGLLIPTFMFWTAFVTAVYAAVGNRYTAIMLSIAALAWTGWRALTGKISWAGNWALWNALRWSDLGPFQRDRTALVLNRLMVLTATLFFIALAVRLFRRRSPDAVQTIHRLAPGSLWRSALRLAPVAVIPLALWIALLFQVAQGPEGGAGKKARKDYWAKNLKTWMDAPVPDIARADVAVRLDPGKSHLESRGVLTLVNGLDSTLARIPMTGGFEWKNVKWTMNGRAVTPDDSKKLYVFTPPHPLAKGDSVTIGWSFDSRFPDGISKNNGNLEEFVLPSGIVLTGFTPSFMPVLGFMEDVGETKENKTEPRHYPRDYWKGITPAGYGATAWFPARVTVTGPADYTLNSVGVCTSNIVKNGWRTQVWETDHPVKLLNVICGHWKERRGNGTTIYYASMHGYNVDTMSRTLDAARKYYSEWFLPYPWKELKLSEFPALAGYAQGFGTNITFSENIGFLTRNDAKTNATFLVTAHESAHQWWGNIVTPAKGPGADFLSESMAHFSTMLLFDKVLGPRERMEFLKGLESRYGDRRRVDDERAMYDVDGKRESDETVIYDRGGWVMWMLYDYLGHDRALDGYRAFCQAWSVSRDHPVLQDLVAAMRPYAADPVKYDAFVKEWFEDKAMPEYRIENAVKSKTGGGYDVTATVKNIGTGTMPVEIAATSGERWKKPATPAATGPGTAQAATVPPTAAVPPPTTEQDPKYREARSTVTLAANESRRVTIHCNFAPEKLVVDPDVRVLQLRRKQAVASL